MLTLRLLLRGLSPARMLCAALYAWVRRKQIKAQADMNRRIVHDDVSESVSEKL